LNATEERVIPCLWTPQADGGIKVTPHPGQQAVLDSPARFIFALAGSQGGKTSLGPIWLYREIERRGAGDYLAVTSSFPLLKLKMLTEFMRLFKEHLNLGRWIAGDKCFLFSNAVSESLFGQTDIKTRVIFGSAVNANSLESATAKGAWLDEVGQDMFRLESWEAVQRRLTLHQGRVLAGTTLYNLGWLKQEVYDRWVRGDPTYDIVQFPSTANPAFPPEEYERLRASMPAWKFAMFMEGKFSKPANLIYSDFEDSYREVGGNKVRPFALPPEWPRYVGVDFGGVHTATIWLARDPLMNVYYLYREGLEGGKTTVQHCAENVRKGQGENVMGWFGGSASEDQWRRDWRAAGIHVQEPRVASVEGGIDRVIALFKTKRLFVFDDCKGTLDELGTYQRELDLNSNPIEKIRDKETFHHLDALRYVAQGLDNQSMGGSFVYKEEKKLKWL
jgi:hypothetical protein